MPKYQFDVQVQPHYLPEQSSPAASVFHFSYTITITNTGDTPAQLLSRHWTISDANGHTEEVQGPGVVGHQPRLKPGESVQYSSGCQLRTPSGTMHGSYACRADDGTPFTSTIALFLLEAQDPGTPDQPLGRRVLH